MIAIIFIISLLVVLSVQQQCDDDHRVECQIDFANCMNFNGQTSECGAAKPSPICCCWSTYSDCLSVLVTSTCPEDRVYTQSIKNDCADTPCFQNQCPPGTPGFDDPMVVAPPTSSGDGKTQTQAQVLQNMDRLIYDIEQANSIFPGNTEQDAESRRLWTESRRAQVRQLCLRASNASNFSPDAVDTHQCPDCCENVVKFDPHGAECLDTGATALVSFVVVFLALVVPGVGITQTGTVAANNAVSTLLQTFLWVCTGTLLWFLLGYSFSFGAGSFWGWSTESVLFVSLPTTGCLNGQHVPVLLHALFQLMFALVAPVIVAGAWLEKLHLGPQLVFAVCWSLVVYYPMTHWIKGSGFLHLWGARDFAGGIFVHTVAGVAGLVVALFLPSRPVAESMQRRGHNLPLAMIGSALILSGWLAFNGGSALTAGTQLASALVNSHIAMISSAVVWVMLTYVNAAMLSPLDSKSPRWSLASMFNGLLAGIASISSSSGYVEPYGALIIGLVVGACSWASAQLLANVLKIDDNNVFSVHAVSGFVGAVLLGLFASPRVDQSVVGAFYGDDGSLFGKQIAAVCIICVWTAFVTAIIMTIIKHTIMFDLSQEAVLHGLDFAQTGQQAYDSAHVDPQVQQQQAIQLQQVYRHHSHGGHRRGSRNRGRY